jgi:hypothetical protein
MKTNKTFFATGGSLISSLLSFLPVTCCAFPAAFSFLGVGSLAFAARIQPYRPYFIGLTAIFLAIGFYFAYRPRKCEPGNECEVRGKGRIQKVSIWVALIISIAFVIFPYLAPYLSV